MDPVVLAAASCLLQIVDTSLERTDDGAWLEHTLVEAAAKPTCEWLAWPLPPSATFEGWSGKARLGDGTRRKLVDERWETEPRGLDQRGMVRLHLPDLVSGDRIVVEIERRWSDEGLTWAPGPFRYAALQVTDDAASVELTGLAPNERDGGWVAAPADAATRALVAGGSPALSSSLLPVGSLSEERRLTLLVPRGDPQVALFPGGGSAVRIERFLSIAPSEDARGLVLDAPADAEISVEAQPRGIATLEQSPGLTLLRIEPSEAPARIAVAWEQADAPTFGEVPADVDELVVDAPGGAISWEGRSWRLVEMHERPVLPVREVLLKALDNRYRSLALPEPGAPMELRGRPAGWELAADLRPTLLGRASPAPFDQDPLFPRKLTRARRSGVLSRTEAALILWLYARQLGLRADWAIARPATYGAGPAESPAGFTHALIRVAHEGEVRWIDPLCTVCAPFELHPDLQGAAVLSPTADRTPEPESGTLDVDVRADGTATWVFEGPPATLLRAWLLEVPTHRTRALAERLGGPGSGLIELEGLEEAGAPVRVVVQQGTGARRDPLALPVPDGDETAWLDWIGRRTVRWPGHDLPEVQATAGPLTLQRTVTDDAVVEVLDVTDRLVDAADLRAIEAARWSPPEPQVPPEEADPQGDEPVSRP